VSPTPEVKFLVPTLREDLVGSVLVCAAMCVHTRSAITTTSGSWVPIDEIVPRMLEYARWRDFDTGSGIGLNAYVMCRLLEQVDLYPRSCAWKRQMRSGFLVADLDAKYRELKAARRQKQVPR
jgi:hypothetical protein